jgi:hypothetical protein
VERAAAAVPHPAAAVVGSFLGHVVRLDAGKGAAPDGVRPLLAVLARMAAMDGAARRLVRHVALPTLQLWMLLRPDTAATSALGRGLGALVRAQRMPAARTRVLTHRHTRVLRVDGACLRVGWKLRWRDG